MLLVFESVEGVCVKGVVYWWLLELGVMLLIIMSCWLYGESVVMVVFCVIVWEMIVLLV